MKRSIIIHAEGETRDEAEGRAPALVGLEWAGEPHVVTRIGATGGPQGGWRAVVFSSTPDEGVTA